MTSAAVLGWALRTSLGATLDEVVARVLAGERGGGAALGAPEVSRHQRFLPRLPLLALEAAHEAARQAGIAGGDHVGVFAGVGGLRIEWSEVTPMLRDQRDDGAGAWVRGLAKLHPFWMLRNLSNNGHALLAADLGARGEGATFGGATAGAQAIASATRALAAGTIDIAVVVAYDTLLAPELGFVREASGAPYGDVPGGAAPGEATAALVLARDGRGDEADGTARGEAAAASRGRGAAPGEVGAPREGRGDGVVPGKTAAARDGRGDGTGARLVPATRHGVVPPQPPTALVPTADARALAYLIAASAADGEPDEPRGATLARVAARVVDRARSGIVVDGAGRANLDLDRDERAALASIVDDQAPLVATSAALGHLGAAGSVVQAIVMGELLRRGVIPPIAGLARATPGPLRPLTAAEPAPSRFAVCLSTGAPGLAAAVGVEVVS